MKHLLTKSLLLCFAIVATLLCTSVTTFGAARIVIVNADGPNEGFNDPTPATPVGGNTGTTIGQQRLIAFQFAADIWGRTIDSNVEIRVLSNFDPLPCTATTAVLGAAGARPIHRNFPGAEFFNTWYHGALADKRANRDLSPGISEIGATFNSNLGRQGCLTGGGFYYGLDTNTPEGQTNLVIVLLHEFAHGLGFSNFVDLTTGARFANADDIFIRYLRDNELNKQWTEMTNAERRVSAVNTGQVVWTGPNVTTAAPTVLDIGDPLMRVNSPANFPRREIPITVAEFGSNSQLPPSGLTGDVVLVNDGSTSGTAPGSTTGTVTDGCQPLVNAAEVSGKIALIDRGTCTFVSKVRNAQAAGAIGVIIANSAGGDAPSPIDRDATDITIPTVTVTLADGNRLRTAITSGSTVNVTLLIDQSRLAGADAQNRVQMYAPEPLDTGSSISHWTTRTTPNQLMEPFISRDLTFSVRPDPVNASERGDLTLSQLRDIGWFEDVDANGLPDNVDVSPPIFRLTATLTRSCATGEYLATFTLTNRGTSTANNVLVESATLNRVSSTTIGGGFVFALGTLAPGQSATRTLRFPSTAGTPGTRAPLVVYGIDTTTFLGSSFSSGTSNVLPACTQ